MPVAQYGQIEDRIFELTRIANKKLLTAYENRIKNLEAEFSSLKTEIHALIIFNIILYNITAPKATILIEKIEEDRQKILLINFNSRVQTL